MQWVTDMGQKQPSKDIKEKFQALLKTISVLEVSPEEDESLNPNVRELPWMPSRINPYPEIIDAIFQVCPNVSKKTIDKELRKLISKLRYENRLVNEDSETSLKSLWDVIDETAIQAELNALLELLRTKVQTHTVLVPLTGLILRIPTLNIGEITIYPNGSGPLSEIMETQWFITEAHKEEFQNEGCYAEIPNFEGDTQYTLDEVSVKMYPVIDVLNLYLASCEDRRKGFSKISFGIYPSGILDVYTKPRSGGVWASGKLLSYRPYEIYPDLAEIWKNGEFDEIARCCLGKDRGPKAIESRIKRSITWYSKAVNSDGAEEQFVALNTALEGLLLGNEGGSITQRLADRVAFLLRKTYEDRFQLSGEIKDLYELRSKVVHGGKPVLPKKLGRMNNLVRGTIFMFVHMKFKSWDNFIDWNNKQIYTTPDKL